MDYKKHITDKTTGIEINILLEEFEKDYW